MTKIDIFSGFLGAGKTTLIKKLLQDGFSKEKLVLIENEFGEIGIDGGFLKDAGIEITEMNSGCICCSLVGDFSNALKKVMDEYHPDRILIEPSGVGKLSDVIQAVKDLKDERVELHSFVTVVDALKCKMYQKNFKEFFENQVIYATTIVMSRTQKVSEDKLKETVGILKEMNPHANIITTPWDEIPGNRILSAMEQHISLEEELWKEEPACPVCGEHHDHEVSSCEHSHHYEHHHAHPDHEHAHENCSCGHGYHHHADDVFRSWGVETIHTYTKEELESILKELSEDSAYGTILRAKGMVKGKDKKWLYFDLVPQEYQLREGSADYTGRVCVIGSELNADKLKQLFYVE